MPASTLMTVRAEVRVVVLDVAIVRLTRFRRFLLLERNLITVFSAVNNKLQIILGIRAPSGAAASMTDKPGRSRNAAAASLRKKVIE